MNKIVAYARLLRIPGLGGLAIPPIIGAVTVGVTDIYQLVLLFIIGACAAIYGFILNDFADIELDRLVKELSGKPLVSGDISRKNAIFICFLCVLFAFLSMILLWNGKIIDTYKTAAAICMVLAGILGSIYDIYGKRFIASDLLVALSMGLVFLFGALSFGAPTPITWIVFILTFENLLYMNAIENGIKDADHDHLMKVQNIALTLGVKVDGTNLIIPRSFQIFALSIRLFSAILFFAPFFMFHYPYAIWHLVLLTIGLLLVFIFSIKLLSLKIFNRDHIRKYIGIQSFIRYSLVPIMIMPLIGDLQGIILIIFPILWYILLTLVFGEKLFKPRM
ncbi:MAG: UbiA prenyltransferase family protein [Candidatus Thermoplasmatota archaeon]